ncbi:hypothetical protein TNCT_401542 [Trichonephila clavata]|uniref:Uncharacterized protein n=1 Tax=Trichonephila clavata TaxID=2740835 RepID=A0A8X6KUA2_TRICU|nr:hypothetical protein TNCT_401542 [Trichonephila clavata]
MARVTSETPFFLLILKIREEFLLILPLAENKRTPMFPGILEVKKFLKPNVYFGDELITKKLDDFGDKSLLQRRLLI